MSNKSPRSASVAFKVEPELAELLNHLPNKSEFIRRAIAAQLGACCPLCNGKGIVSRGIHDHYKPLILANRHQPCAGCGHDMPIPDEAGELASRDRMRLEQFFHGGPLYCEPCYREAATCGECGWHLDTDRLVDHMRLNHQDD